MPFVQAFAVWIASTTLTSALGGRIAGSTQGPHASPWNKWFFATATTTWWGRCSVLAPAAVVSPTVRLPP